MMKTLFYFNKTLSLLDLLDPAVPRYKLHSSILRLSLKNLKVLWNLEKGEGKVYSQV